MKKIALLIAPLLALSLALTGCGKKNAESESASDQVASTQGNKLTEDQTDGALVSIKGVFGETTAIEGDIDITVSQPQNFVPSADAQNYTEELTVNTMEITIKNGSTEDLDTSSIVFSADSGVNTCLEIIDPANGYEGVPVVILPVGESISFKYATGCVGKPGENLVVKTWFSAAKVNFTGTIA
ncbi:MAG: hypothetical protein ACO3FB_00070 [Candidatus Nanopelagicaceae bacterium]